MSDSMLRKPSILVVGEHDTGKSHYGGQLLRRLQSMQGALRMLGTPEDLTHFKEVCGSLAEGRAAVHTPSNVYRESTWEIGGSDGARTLLIWPDYAGEQVGDITARRQVTDAWQRRIRDSDAWLFLVRLGSFKPIQTILERPRAIERLAGSGHAGATEPSALVAEQHHVPNVSGTLSDQARLIELLQAMLFVRQVDLSQPLSKPPIFVMLSCFDELHYATTDGEWVNPGAVFAERLPLLNDFIDSNWHSDARAVVGLSALGRSLKQDVGDDEFIDNGPERQGWCILPNGEKSSDLTLPLALLISKLAPL